MINKAYISLCLTIIGIMGMAIGIGIQVGTGAGVAVLGLCLFVVGLLLSVDGGNKT